MPAIGKSGVGEREGQLFTPEQTKQLEAMEAERDALRESYNAYLTLGKKHPMIGGVDEHVMEISAQLAATHQRIAQFKAKSGLKKAFTTE